MLPKVEKQNIVLRKWRSGDEDAIVKHANNYEVVKYLKDSFPYPYTHADAQRWVYFASHQASAHFLAIEVENEVVGCVGIEKQQDVYRKSAELGYWIGQEYWNRGIMTHVVSEMVEYAFSKFDIVRLYAHVFEGNIGSVRVLEKAGFVQEAIQRKAVCKEGRFLDQFVYAIVRI